MFEDCNNLPLSSMCVCFCVYQRECASERARIRESTCQRGLKVTLVSVFVLGQAWAEKLQTFVGLGPG